MCLNRFLLNTDRFFCFRKALKRVKVSFKELVCICFLKYLLLSDQLCAHLHSVAALAPLGPGGPGGPGGPVEKKHGRQCVPNLC